MFIKFSRSFKYIANSNRERFSPCLTPFSHVKYPNEDPFIVIHDYIPLYIFVITLKISPSIPCFNNYCHSPSLHILSKAFVKSTKQQNSFRFLLLKYSIKLWRAIIVSIVVYSLHFEFHLRFHFLLKKLLILNL